MAIEAMELRWRKKAIGFRKSVAKEWLRPWKSTRPGRQGVSAEKKSRMPRTTSH